MLFPKINIFKYKYIFQILDEEEEKEEREIGDEEEEEREMGVKNEELEEVDAVPSRRHSRNPLKAREYSQIATNYRHLTMSVQRSATTGAIEVKRGATFHQVSMEWFI